MNPKLARELKAAVAALLLSLLLAIIVAAVPLENILSAYPFIRAYPWYVYWRVAAAMFLLWIVSISLASRERVLIRWLAVASALLLAASHYAALAVEGAAGVRIRVLPLFYVVEAAGGSTLKLDVAQVVLLATAVESILTLRRAPRTASGGQRTPSR